MTLTQHAALTAGAAVVLAPFWDWEKLLVFAVGSVLIDADHYLYFVWRRRRLGVREMFAFHDELFRARDRIPYAGVCLFHTVDCFALTAALSVFFPPLRYLLAGFLFHFALDVVFLHRHRYLFGRAFSLAEHFLRKRRHPGYPYFR